MEKHYSHAVPKEELDKRSESVLTDFIKTFYRCLWQKMNKLTVKTIHEKVRVLVRERMSTVETNQISSEFTEEVTEKDLLLNELMKDQDETEFEHRWKRVNSTVEKSNLFPPGAALESWG